MCGGSFVVLVLVCVLGGLVGLLTLIVVGFSVDVVILVVL